MNMQQVALFQYSVNYFFGLSSESKEKKCVWKLNQQLFTACFYDSTLFKKNADSQDFFNDTLRAEILHIDSYGDSINKFKNNLPLLIDKLSNFVVSNDLSKYNLSDKLLAKNVSFIGKNISDFDFYLFPKNANFEVVSIISSETLDQNV